MLTTVLVVATSVLATLAVALGVIVLRDSRSRDPRAEPVPEPPPAAPPEPQPLALEAPTRGLDQDLQRAAVRAAELPTTPVAGRSAVPEAASGSGVRELEALLGQTLETACAIPGADAALVAVTFGREPIIGTLGLARHEADRLATTLPSPAFRTRSIEIAYEYDREPYDTAAVGRIERGIAVPVRGPAPALLAILTRAPAASLGEPQLALLQEVAHRLEPPLAALGDARATRMPATITVREFDSVQSEERHEAGQVDWLRRG